MLLALSGTAVSSCPVVPVFVLRAAGPADIDAVQTFAGLLDTVNLPPDRAALGQILEASARAWAGESTDSAPPHAGRYVFVLIDTDEQIVGVSMVIAAHGTPRDPHHFFRVEPQQRYSTTLDRLFEDKLLRFQTQFSPHTELGALVLAPHLRGHSARPGRLLSWGRLLWVAAAPSQFCQEIQAELLPPVLPDGTSAVWNWLGARYTGLDYLTADRLSRTNHEFMRALFPRDPIPMSLLPTDVVACIGVVGAGSVGAERLLRQQGFAPNGHVDPFDGGPHVAATLAQIPLIAHARRLPIRSLPAGAESALALVAVAPPDGPYWCTQVEVGFADPAGVQLADPVRALLPAKVDCVWVSPVDPATVRQHPAWATGNRGAA